MSKYNVIYADPPWNQKAGRKLSGYVIEDGKQVWPDGDKKTENLPYNTMSINDICNLDVESVTADDAFLFMWVTNKYLTQAEKVIKAWGFDYSSCIVWKKKKMGGGLGGLVRITSEFLLYCRKGKPKATGVIEESVFEVKRPYVNGYPCHSKKPAFFAELIESVTPAGARLEMFCREKREGWDVFGNQCENSITINTKTHSKVSK